jgi:hypothetical protein
MTNSFIRKIVLVAIIWTITFGTSTLIWGYPGWGRTLAPIAFCIGCGGAAMLQWIVLGDK